MRFVFLLCFFVVLYDRFVGSFIFSDGFEFAFVRVLLLYHGLLFGLRVVLFSLRFDVVYVLGMYWCWLWLACLGGLSGASGVTGVSGVGGVGSVCVMFVVGSGVGVCWCLLLVVFLCILVLGFRPAFYL